MPFFNAEIAGLETLENDYEQHFAKIDDAIQLALQDVGSEMVSSLQKHIKEDVYAAYAPKSYQRRSENYGTGTPLTDTQNMSVETKHNELIFSYNPTGEHVYSVWHTRDDDTLITAIQNGKLWGKPPKRPFWNNFVEEQFNEAIMQNFINGMPEVYKPTLKGKNLTYSGNEAIL